MAEVDQRFFETFQLVIVIDDSQCDRAADRRPLPSPGEHVYLIGFKLLPTAAAIASLSSQLG